MDNTIRGLYSGTSEDHIRNRHHAYLQFLVDNDENSLSSFKSKCYGNEYHNILQRYSKSINYHVRDWLQSLQRVLVGKWGEGSGRGIGLWGIHPRNRPFMLLHAHECVGYTAPDDNKLKNDQLCPLPHMNIEFLEVLVAEGSISAERVVFEKEVRDDTLRSVE